MSGSGSKSRTSNEVDAWLATGHRPFVVVISGPSGVGKSSFVKQLLARDGLYAALWNLQARIEENGPAGEVVAETQARGVLEVA